MFETLAQPITIIGIFVLSSVGGLMAFELRRLHNRIDKYQAKLDKHIDDSVGVHKLLARIDERTKGGGP